MRVGLVRTVALGMVALVGLGLAGCDDNPIESESDEAVKITTNPSAMTVPAGVTTLLSSRTENLGNEPTWDEITATVDGSCGPGAVTVDVAATYEPSIQPPGQFDVTGGTTLGATCIQLSGGGVDATVEVTVVGHTLEIIGASDFLDLLSSVDLDAVLLSSGGAPVTPFDDATDIVWESSDEDVLTVDADGVVEAVGVGAADITATWTEFGIEVTATAVITTNQPTINIVGAPVNMVFGDTEDLSAEFLNPDDPPSDFGPFDENTDLIWSSSDETIMTVDASTGEVEAVGAGTATIRATWTGHADVFGEVDITVQVPAPTLTSTDVAAAQALETVTITGTGFLPGAHIVLIDGAEVLDFYEPMVIDATTATVVMPGGPAADLAITVGVPGNESNALTVSRTCGTSDESCATEPDNDAAAGAPDLGTLPVSFAGYVDGDDPNDLLELTLLVETTFDILLDWTGASGDLDVVFTTTGATDFSEAECDFVTATGSQPESGQCTLAAGTYYLWVGSYDLEFAFYELNLTQVF